VSTTALPTGVSAFRTQIDANFQTCQDSNEASKTATFTVFADDAAGSPKGTYLCDATAGAITANLPACASTRVGRRVTAIKVDASGNAVTFDGSGAEQINGATTLALSAQWQYATLENTGTRWIVVGNT